MGVIYREIRVPDLHQYNQEFNRDGTEKHITCDGARFHVLSWGGGSKGSWTRCSEKNCEINKRTDGDQP